ncbi:2-amino-3-ketobutyrate coenzyme A ligase, mitochondrial [Cryptotermes secundus]|uniref:2-amino-3-ketobutyrate coenzyme A ligase, mitochondrial n=1 Tax=Cryptotermes secundus TaxID=105785 RepID=A0A2J7RN05_9NEOP|nr:2-amino-3-ketobutyrate coenzyme A ligase, mitochondrial isoform X2 [Cryptotermes secundus]PNF42220.1 2-amino-3-ketobutyrate coenzyme A ligase, mitochondrial [Cryptotermes secundus]
MAAVFRSTVPRCVPVLYRRAHCISSLREIAREEIGKIKDSGTWKSERVITSKQGSLITVVGHQQLEILNFCSNNYLGLASHPHIIAAAQAALQKYGAGLSSVRFICGTQDIHKELEHKIANFHGRDDAILYPSCFDANAGIFEVLLTDRDAVFSDELNHASIIDGLRLCKARKHRYLHLNMSDLEQRLREEKNARLKLIVTDGVFSMDGDIAPLDKICELGDKYNALVFVDEAHATGFFGKTGRGTEEYHNIIGKVDIINSTLGKAMGGASGGYTTGPKELIDLLRQRGRPYLFSNSLPPPVVAAGIKAFDIVLNSNNLAERLRHNTKRFRDAMTKAGFTIGGSDHPICPVMLYEERLASVFADEMLARGIYVIGFSYPVVPNGKTRIRVQLSTSHSDEDIDKAVNVFVEVGKKLDVIS